MIGIPLTGTNGLGTVSVSGANLVPSPAAKRWPPMLYVSEVILCTILPYGTLSRRVNCMKVTI